MMNEPADWDRPHLSGGALRMTNDLLKYNSNKQTTFFGERRWKKTHTGDAYHLGGLSRTRRDGFIRFCQHLDADHLLSAQIILKFVLLGNGCVVF
jgi:hypothetical protein